MRPETRRIRVHVGSDEAMNCNRLTIGLFSVLLAGCASLDGSYWPGCPAFAGRNITLTGGRFVWDKFTDEVKLDDDGNFIDPFPGYPKRGSYRIDGTTVMMESDSGEAMPEIHWVRHDSRPYLLSAGQFTTWQETSTVEKCALTRHSDGEN